MPTNIELRPRRAGLATLVGLLATICGCGEPLDRLPLHPAAGKVVIDGRPEPGVQIRLHPVDRLTDSSALQPFAESGEDGGFRLGTYKKDDGRRRAATRPPCSGPTSPRARSGRSTSCKAGTTTPPAPTSM